jgi:hypothetical protein
MYVTLLTPFKSKQKDRERIREVKSRGAARQIFTLDEEEKTESPCYNVQTLRPLVLLLTVPRHSKIHGEGVRMATAAA